MRNNTRVPSFTLSLLPLLLLPLLLLPLHSLADHLSPSVLPCEGHVHHYFDGAHCRLCTRSPCGIGLFRETCTESSTHDAECVPCKPPPAMHAVHTTGGLPFMEDNCMWACEANYFRLEVTEGLHECLPCSTDPCPYTDMSRPFCPLGSTEDAQCKCPLDTYIDPDVQEGATETCKPCMLTECADGLVLVRCLGTEDSDVSACEAVGQMGLHPDPSSTERREAVFQHHEA